MATVASEAGVPTGRSETENRVALVTGASSGLGLRFAAVLAQAGLRVALAGRRMDRLEHGAQEIRDAGGTCLAVLLDVTEPETFPAALDVIEDKLGAVDILVNNAGIPDANYAIKLSLESIDKVIATNLTAPYVLSCEVARRLISSGKGGRIINISSMSAYTYSPTSAASLYSTTKAAVSRMTEVLALEWAKFGINVNAIAPGMIASEMTQGLIERVGDVSNQFPRRRVGDPSMLDSTLLYLASPDSEFITGTIIKADDGQSPR